MDFKTKAIEPIALILKSMKQQYLNKSHLCHELINLGLQGKMLNIIISLRANTETIMKYNRFYIDFFINKSSVLQVKF